MGNEGLGWDPLLPKNVIILVVTIASCEGATPKISESNIEAHHDHPFRLLTQSSGQFLPSYPCPHKNPKKANSGTFSDDHRFYCS